MNLRVIISENLLCFRFSVSNDLKYDAERDLKDIDAPNIPVFALNKVCEMSRRGYIFISIAHIRVFQMWWEMELTEGLWVKR